MTDSQTVSAISSFLRQASRVAVLTGSGVSAESGIPTFREAQTGLWARYDPHELATSRAFRRNPRLVWEWYAWRRELVAGAGPNGAHFALVELENWVPSLKLITQNVDGLHQEAGSRAVLELHGNIKRTRCSREDRFVDSWNAQSEVPPPCPHCGAPLRPDVVWFGEALPVDSLTAAVEAARHCDIFLSIGTSALVQPAASLAHEARAAGATLLEINTAETPLTPYVDYALRGQAAAVLPDLVRSSFYS